MSAASGGAPANKGRLVQQALPGMARLCDTPERTAGIFLRTSAEVYARWFLSLRGAMSREKARQQAYREENGFKRKAKVPSKSLELTPAESAVAAASEGVIRAMFGDGPADYAKFRFECAVRKADMRAFKIRLLMIKARDSLSGSMHEEFKKWAPVYIEEAERVAGCIPCPGPRRMSKAERERKRRREEAKNAYCDLPFGEDLPGRQEPAEPKDKEEEPVKKRTKTHSGPNSVMEALSSPIREGYPCVSKIISSMSEVLGSNTIENLANDIKIEETPVCYLDSSSSSSVTVTHMHDDSGSDVTLETDTDIPAKRSSQHDISEHKARKYSSPAEILEDLKSGRIVPYGSATEIVDDMKCGLLSPPEAMMFITVLDQASESSVKKSRRGRGRKKVDDDQAFEEELENEEDEFEELAEGEKELSFSPEGFGAGWGGEEDE